MTRFRTALIGAGFISASHIEGLRAAVPDAKITAIVDRNLELAQTRAAQWGIPNVFADIEELIAAGVADVAHVLAPPDAHEAIARRLLEAGLHVFLEKPMTTTVGDCEGLTALAAEKSLVLGVNQNFVYHPAYRAARRILLDQRRLGPIRSLHVVFNVPLRQLGARQFQPLDVPPAGQYPAGAGGASAFADRRSAGCSVRGQWRAGQTAATLSRTIVP